jgi:hypothetical protein
MSVAFTGVDQQKLRLFRLPASTTQMNWRALRWLHEDLRNTNGPQAVLHDNAVLFDTYENDL